MARKDEKKTRTEGGADRFILAGTLIAVAGTYPVSAPATVAVVALGGAALGVYKGIRWLQGK